MVSLELPETVKLPKVCELRLDFTVVDRDEDRPEWVKVEWANPDNLLYGKGPFTQRLDLLVCEGYFTEYHSVQVQTRVVVSPGHFVRYRNQDHYATAWVRLKS